MSVVLRIALSLYAAQVVELERVVNVARLTFTIIWVTDGQLHCKEEQTSFTLAF